MRSRLVVLASSAFRRLFMFSKSWRCHTQRTPAGDTDRPCERSAFDRSADDLIAPRQLCICHHNPSSMVRRHGKSQPSNQ